jgi:hypothetical protein
MEKSTFRRENLFPGCSTLLYADCVLTPPEPLGFRPVEMATALFHPEHGLRILVMKEEALKRVFARMPQIQEDYPAGVCIWGDGTMPVNLYDLMKPAVPAGVCFCGLELLETEDGLDDIITEDTSEGIYLRYYTVGR